MIKSMTAFARAESQLENAVVRFEVRAYNSRFLDVVIRMPQSHPILEEKLRAKIAERVLRGRVEVRVSLKEEHAESEAFDVNLNRARALVSSLNELKKACSVGGEPTLEMLVNAGDVLRPAEIERDPERTWALMEGCLDQALEALDAMRSREGENLAADISGRIERILDHVQRIESESRDMLETYRDRLKERIGALTRDIIEIDEGRVVQEAAFLAERSDITEEIVRARSHLDQFRDILQADDSAGRKLNFLLQELNREFNTMGAKTEKSRIAHRVVEVKAELEKIREQVQNIE